MVAEGAFVLGSELAHGGLGAQVFVVGLEADAAEVEGFEGVGELEELGLGVYAGSVVVGAEPGVAYFYGAVLKVEVDVAGAADDLVGLGGGLRFQDRDPGHSGACGFEFEGGLGPGAEVGGGFDRGEHVAPNARVKRDLLEGREVTESERLETDSGTFEDWGGHRIYFEGMRDLRQMKGLERSLWQ